MAQIFGAELPLFLFGDNVSYAKRSPLLRVEVLITQVRMPLTMAKDARDQLLRKHSHLVLLLIRVVLQANCLILLVFAAHGLPVLPEFSRLDRDHPVRGENFLGH